VVPLYYARRLERANDDLARFALPKPPERKGKGEGAASATNRKGDAASPSVVASGQTYALPFASDGNVLAISVANAQSSDMSDV
jgi:hypothetical protein